jgi:hypothetical protein
MVKKYFLLIFIFFSMSYITVNASDTYYFKEHVEQLYLVDIDDQYSPNDQEVLDFVDVYGQTYLMLNRFSNGAPYIHLFKGTNITSVSLKRINFTGTIYNLQTGGNVTSYKSSPYTSNATHEGIATILYPYNWSIPATYTFAGGFTLPLENYRDNTLHWAFKTYYDIPEDADINKLVLDITVDGSKESYHHGSVARNYKFSSANGVERWLFDFSLNFNDYGTHTVTVKGVYDGQVIGEYSRSVEALSGFIDEDGDGLDDRTGNDYVPPIEYPEPEEPYDWTNPLDYLRFAKDSIVTYIEDLVTGINVMVQKTGQMKNIMSDYFAFVPSEIQGALFMGVVVVLILKFLAR